MILLTGIVIGFFVVPDEWTVPVILGAAVLEVTETAITWWWSRRHPPKVGPETLIGSSARVIEACRPYGTVRVRGEIWQARCEAGANRDEAVTVVAREGLVLVVEQSASVGLS